MAYNRTGYAPWSLTREAGVQSATVDGTIEVPQYIQPVLDTGFVDEKGNWKGTKSNEEEFVGFTIAEGIPNSGTALFPDTNLFPSIDMTGFTNIFIAFRPNNSGNAALTAVMGPETVPFANLTPISAASNLIGNAGQRDPNDLTALFTEDDIGMTADVWNIYYISNNLQNQKNMQFKLTNSNFGNSNFEFAFMRMV